MACELDSVALIGFGKFGQLAHKLLKRDLPEGVRLAVCTKDAEPGAGVEFIEFSELANFKVIILAVPTAQLSSVLTSLAESFGTLTDKLVIDVCSVKIYPKEQMLKLLPESWELICTHPLFGPASYRANHHSTRDFLITVEVLRVSKKHTDLVLGFLQGLRLKVLEMSADEHDQHFGQPQFLTHFAAALFKNSLNVESTFDGLRSVDLFRASLKLLTADEGLLKDMFQFNPYARASMQKLDERWAVLKKTLEANG
jgi:prephenate dehydrogenase